MVTSQRQLVNGDVDDDQRDSLLGSSSVFLEAFISSEKNKLI